MNDKYPEWASKKQIEGMDELLGVAGEYGVFEVEFKPSDWGDDCGTRFYAIVSWGSKRKGVRVREFDIAYDYETYFDVYGNETKCWQFLFSGGDATREISTEVFFLDLFFYLDDLTIIKS